MRILAHFGIVNCSWKVGIILKLSVNIAEFLVQPVLMLPEQNVSNLLVGSMYNGNINTFWYRKLSMKSWYSSKIFENIANFSCMIFCTKKLFQYPQLTYYSHFLSKFFPGFSGIHTSLAWKISKIPDFTTLLQKS